MKNLEIYPNGSRFYFKNFDLTNVCLLLEGADLFLNHKEINHKKNLPKNIKELSFFNPYDFKLITEDEKKTLKFNINLWSFTIQQLQDKDFPKILKLLDIPNSVINSYIASKKAEKRRKLLFDAKQQFFNKFSQKPQTEESIIRQMYNSCKYPMSVSKCDKFKKKCNYAFLKYPSADDDFMAFYAHEMPADITSVEINAMKKHISQGGELPKLVSLSEDEKRPNYEYHDSWSPCDNCINGTSTRIKNVSCRLLKGYHSVSGPGNSHSILLTDSIDIMFACAYILNRNDI